MSVTPRPAEPFQLFLEHYVNAASSPAACDWVGVDEFADYLFCRPALLKGAVLRSISVPNWAQSFARRDAYFPLYRQVGGMLFKEATDTIPIVALTGDPVRQGLVKTLAHPSGNITGVSVDAGPSIHGKRAALLREMCPRAKKLAFMTFRGLWERQGEEVRAIAQTLGIDVVGYPLDLPANETVYRDTIAMAKVDGADAIMVGDNPDAMNNRVLIAKLIDATGLPAIYPFAEFVSAGGLMAYSFDLIELNKRVADDIAVILNGTNPGDIPFYQAVKFELSLNLKTARALSLDVPATLMAAANEVIE